MRLGGMKMKKGLIIGFAAGLTVAGASLVFANSQIQAILNDGIKVIRL